LADGCLKMHIEDNGVGFQVQEAFSRRDCFGLSGLRERVALLGGTLVVKSLPKAKSLDSAGKVGPSKQLAGKAAGLIGVDRHGTSIQIELPVLKADTAPMGSPGQDEPLPPAKTRKRAGKNARTSSR
jgi:glucose-6-phosphate-specific signal transduction histidine kinase